MKILLTTVAVALPATIGLAAQAVPEHTREMPRATFKVAIRRSSRQHPIRSEKIALGRAMFFDFRVSASGVSSVWNWARDRARESHPIVAQVSPRSPRYMRS
ncbi:cytochrome c peroxidase [Mesorhizobium shonense]|uniref:Cytochrome c peroxidase n=1 Tax=Mesorhizobium shonense TaxID=1209948 RepID=A0ABV2I586_9HYPH